jgi:hypothetical protein
VSSSASQKGIDQGTAYFQIPAFIGQHEPFLVRLRLLSVHFAIVGTLQKVSYELTRRPRPRLSKPGSSARLATSSTVETYGLHRDVLCFETYTSPFRSEMQQYNLAALPPKDNSCIADISINDPVTLVLCICRFLELVLAYRRSICRGSKLKLVK